MTHTENRISSAESILPNLATKADLKDLEVRLTRLIYALGIGILISVIGSLASIALTLARLL